MNKDLIEDAKALLKDAGYIVLPKERRVILQYHSIIPAWIDDDSAKHRNLKGLIHSAEEAGLIQHLRQDFEDHITGKEVLFRSLMGVIKPREAPSR